MGRPPKKYHFTTVHHWDDFEIEESDWADIESQSGYKLIQSSRSEILALIRYFLPMAEGERNAPLLYAPNPKSGNPSKRSEAENRLRKIKLRATDLRNALNEIQDYTSENPALSADDLIGMNCDRPELGGKAMPPKAKFCTRQLANILKDFVAACNAATQELKMLEGKGNLPKGFKRSEPFKDGDAWNECVATIANVLTKEGLRVSTTPNKSGQSNFVRLIEALHKRIPPNLVPKRSGDDALEKAIQRAIHQKTRRTV